MRDNRSHRISMARKKAINPIKKGLLGTGIDQFKEGGKYYKDNDLDTTQK